MKPRHWHWHIQPNPVCQSIAVCWSLKTTLSLSLLYLLLREKYCIGARAQTSNILLISFWSWQEGEKQRETSQSVRKAREKKMRAFICVLPRLERKRMRAFKLVLETLILPLQSSPGLGLCKSFEINFVPSLDRLVLSFRSNIFHVRM